jgi:hypothetical protein
MNSKRKTLIVVAVIVFVVFLIIGNLFIPKDMPEPTPTPFSARKAPANSYFSTDEETAEEFTFSEDTITAGGGKVINFYKDNPSISPKGDVHINENPNFDIFYFKIDDTFLITITASPFEDKRNEAEQSFLEKMEIDEEAACKLRVVITTPEFVNPDEATKNYPLSFCE